MKRGTFIVIDGMDHSGKDTQIDLLKTQFTCNEAVFTREPGGAPIAEIIRERLMNRKNLSNSPTEDLVLFCAARVMHVCDVVEPALSAGKNVFTNRYDSSTWAYQIYGEQKLELASLFGDIRGKLPEIYRPAAYIFLMMPPAAAYARGQAATEKERTHYDAKPLEFYERVAEGFTCFRNVAIGSEVHYIDANRSREAVQHNLWDKLQQILAA